MKTFLLTWNPKYGSWPDFSYAVSQINQELPYDIYWSFRSTNKVQVGDKFFLMKLGGKDNGLIGSGQIISKPYDLPHWDENKASEGKTLPRVDLKFNTLSEVPIIEADYLKEQFDSFNWFPQNSGIEIPEEIAEKLEALWEEKTGESLGELTQNELTSIREGGVKQITVKTYERSAVARQKCIDKYGTKCVICDFDFEKEYGEIGKGFIHVHHLNQIADKDGEYEINPDTDLRPVCANCHAMLHRKRPAYSVDDIKQILDEQVQVSI